MQEVSLVRKILFGVFGTLIGTGYGLCAGVYFQFDHLSRILIAIVAAILIAMLAVGISTSSRESPPLTTFQRLVMISLAPLVLPAGVFGMCVLIGWIGCLLPFMAFASRRRKRKFCQRMMEQGRYAKLEDLQRQLLQGEGTLIEETGPKGAFNIWWTPDVLEGASSSLTREDWEAALSDGAKDSFNARCIDRYLDETKGTALLTSISPRLANSGELARKFPQVKRAVVIHFG